MGIIVHHQPANTALLWNIHVWEAAWDGNNVWDTQGTPTGDGVDFQLPEVRDPRKLQFKYHFTSALTGENGWETDDFARRLSRMSPAEIWTFEASARILYQNPYPVGVMFVPGDILTFHVENPPISRPFPADPSVLDEVSLFALGASSWVDAFPAITRIPLSIRPRVRSSFTAGLSIEVSVGNGPSYETVPATLQTDGTWQATPACALDTTMSIDLVPAVGREPKPYDWIDTSRYFTPTASTKRLYTTEGVYGVCTRAATQFSEPPDR